jgi:streptogramin lyase
MQRHTIMRRLGWSYLLPVLALMSLGLSPSLAAAAPTVTEFPTGSGPSGMTTGPDGNLWFVESTANKIGRLTPAGTLTEFSAGLPANAGLFGITRGPDGNLWFTESNVGRVGYITPAGVITQFSSGIKKDGSPHGIATGADGRLWFAESVGNRIGRITTTGSVTEFGAGIGAGSSPWGITAGPDGNLWFSERGKSRVGRITLSGVVTEFGLPSGLPTGITSGPDGNIWIAESASPGHIARMTTGGTVTEFSAGLTVNGGPTDIVTGSDGNLYFTESSGSGALGQITPSGTITEYASGLSSAPSSISQGGDGNVWFSESTGARVGRLTVAPGAVTSPPLATSSTDATLAAMVTPNAQSTTYRFEWGPTTAYGTTTTTSGAGSGAAPQAVSAAITGLSSGATYHYRVVASNGAGTTNGLDQTFSALAFPIVSTEPATSLGQLSVTINGTVDPNANATSYRFEWGETTSYGSFAPLAYTLVDSDSSDHPVSQTLAGLRAGTTYHYRVVATSSIGTTMGDDLTFTTPLPPPGALTGSASAVAETTATLNGTVDTYGSPTTYHFDLGLTSAYGSQWPESDAPVIDGSGPQALAQPLAALTPDTTYHYRVVATSAVGTAEGADTTFTTPPTPTEPAPPPVPTPPVSPPVTPPVTPPAGGSLLPPATRPVFGTSATLATAAGTVRVLLPGSSEYLDLSAASTVPLGTTIDATNGTVRLTNARDRSGRLQQGVFWAGAFTVRQARTAHAPTVVTLVGRLSCPARTQSAYSAKPKVLRLWGRDNNGRFVSHGKSAVATVRGTAWLLRESCAGTFVSVSRGAVSVRDLVRHRTILLRAGGTYLARRK